MTRSTPFQDRVALVTGAGAGAAVLVSDLVPAGADGERARADLEATAERVRAAGGRAATAALDVTDPAQVDAAVATAKDTFGRLDVLVNNAGTGRGSGRSPR